MTLKMLALAAPLALTAAAPVGGPGEEKLFGNWAVACDNVKRCEATALMPDSWSGDNAPSLDLAREPGPAGQVTLSLSPSDQTYGIVDILIDRKLMGSGAIRDGMITLTGATAEGIARGMATGKQVTLRAHGKVVGTLSLSGASAAMRYIDAEQGRTGGVTALVARGKASAATVPGAKPVPRIQAVKPGRAKPATLTPAELATLRTKAGCDDYTISDGSEPVFQRLDARTTLVIIPCGSGAYQSSYALYVVADGKAKAAPFDIAPQESGSGVSVLIEAEWDPNGNSLDSRAKGRGLGDCGRAQSWVWDGQRFRMTRFIALDVCRLSGDWLTRYRAEAVFK